MGKNARKKLQRRAALIENQSRSNQSSTTDSEVLEKSPVGEESNEIDPIYPNGNINYAMICDEIDQTGWATGQYAHQKNKD